jgi:perosamine synthetase
VEVGFNYRTTEIASAIALSQLRRLSEFNKKRSDNAAYLSKHLRGVALPPPPVETGAMVWHQYTIRAIARDGLVRSLRERDIEAAVYYPETLPEQPLYRDLGYDTAELPVARQLAREVVSLPVHPALSQDDLERIVEAVNAWSETQAAEHTVQAVRHD